MRAVQGVVSTVQGAYINVRDQTARNNNAVDTQSVKTAQMRAVQGVVSTVQGAYINVRDQTARNNNAEMRSISVVKNGARRKQDKAQRVPRREFTMRK